MNWRKGIPNSLTLLRLFMAPFFPFAPSAWRLPMLVLGLLTEFLDGYLARLWDGASNFGRVMDPIADKLFVLSVMVVLVREDYASAAVMALVLIRDIAMVVAALFFFVTGGKRAQMPRLEPTLLGKVTTAFQIIFLIGVMVAQRSPMLLLIPTLALGVWSALDYFLRYRDALLPSRRAAVMPPSS